MKKNIVFAIAAVAAINIGLTSCNKHSTEPPSSGANLITNGSFSTTRDHWIDLSSPADLPPWQVLYGTPQNGAAAGGGDSTGQHGYLQMWGTSSTGEAVWEPLGSPIKAGKKYKLSMWIQFFDDSNPANNPWSRVRVLAFNTMPENSYGEWQTDGSNIVEIGAARSQETSWHQVSMVWTAPANYSNIAINVETDDGMPGWSRIDNVSLQEVGNE